MRISCKVFECIIEYDRLREITSLKFNRFNRNLFFKLVGEKANDNWIRCNSIAFHSNDVLELQRDTIYLPGKIDHESLHVTSRRNETLPIYQQKELALKELAKVFGNTLKRKHQW